MTLQKYASEPLWAARSFGLIVYDFAMGHLGRERCVHGGVISGLASITVNI